jgi:urea carboxylase
MDDRSFRAGNLALGNPEGVAGLECTLIGPKLLLTEPAWLCICGAQAPVTLDGERVPHWAPRHASAGSVVDVGKCNGVGLRVYILFAGGLAVPQYLGSSSTFTLGRFGGYRGRALQKGDLLHVAATNRRIRGPVTDPPELTHAWEIAVAEGPHAAPEFFTEADIDEFYAVAWKVHFNSARTGVRLVGPRPQWARDDGGDAGLHPSNIHDTPYSIGSVDFTGDVPIVLGPDGPSLGGFVCPATVVTAERWKLGQLRPGDTVRFKAVRDRASLSTGGGRQPGLRDNGILGARGPLDGAPEVSYRRAGDDNLLIEYGPMVLDLGLRMRVHSLSQRIADEQVEGIVDLTPGIRSLQLHVDPARLTVAQALDLARRIEHELPAVHDLEVPSRRVRLPLSWDDPATREAIRRYMSGVRPDAPWCPWNIEFIRRINGLEGVEDVRRIVFDAEYLVLGLGDVYLGAPVATPLDPRHRLVTTKYNPARTWTPENAVGIGGAYLCVYGMEGPGGYQFVGRTIPVWRRAGERPPWLLHYFDRISWYPVAAEELLELRSDPAAAQEAIQIEEGSFALSDHERFLERNREEIAAFAAHQTRAFNAERDRWADAGEFVAVGAA